jgi:S-phase kinase-associated protein 1
VCKDPHDAQFIDEIGEDRQQLYDLVLAANYLDVKSLLHLGCAKVASLIKGQPLEKIKDILAQGEKGARVLSKDEEKE